MNEYDEAYAEGYKAQKRGASKQSNPYNHITTYTKWVAWNRGWEAAKNEAQETS